MKTKTILTMAIIAALPFTAMAENISGAMYTAPAHENTNHPAPTTQAGAPFGRIDIDTADQEHIATTAYVKGAYNSAIAAVNKVDARLTGYQGILVNGDSEYIISEVVDGDGLEAEGLDWFLDGDQERLLVSLGGTVWLVNQAKSDINNTISNKRVEIYTTWDDDDVAEVPLVTASGQ